MMDDPDVSRAVDGHSGHPSENPVIGQGFGHSGPLELRRLRRQQRSEFVEDGVVLRAQRDHEKSGRAGVAS